MSMYGPLRVDLHIPEGPVFGPLRIEYVTQKGGVGRHAWPAREWPSVKCAMDAGHQAAAMHKIGTYAIELEIVREGGA